LKLLEGAALADLHIAGISAGDAERSLGKVLRKIMRARYGVNETKDVSVYLLMFRHSVNATGMVMRSDVSLSK
jgi:hypothetical protein